MSTSKLQKINKQHERTRTMLHKRLINMPFQYEDIFEEDVKEFVRQKAQSMSTNTGYLVPALLATTSFVASLTSKIMTTTHSVTANLYTIIVGPPTTGKTQSISIAAQDPMQQLQEAMDLPDFLIKKISSSSGITKMLNETKSGYLISSEIYDVINKLLKSDEENGTGDAQLLCELFSGEMVTYKYATEKVRVIPANTPFSILGSTQMPLMAKLVTRMDQGHGLLDRFLFAIPMCLRPTEDETENAIEQLRKERVKSFGELFNIMYNINHETYYNFNEESKTLLKEISDTFIKEINEAILNGDVPPKSKKTDLIMKVSLAIHLFESITKQLLNGQQPVSPSNVIQHEALQRAINYVDHLESQKEYNCCEYNVVSLYIYIKL